MGRAGVERSSTSALVQASRNFENWCPPPRASGVIPRIAGLGNLRAINKVADIGSIRSRRQGRTVHVGIGAHGLWVVHRVPSLVVGRAVREIANIVHKFGQGQRRTVHVGIRANGLWVVHRVPSLVVGRAVRKVANIIAKLEWVHASLVLVEVASNSRSPNAWG